MTSQSRKLITILLLMIVIAVSAWFGRKAYRKVVERRMVTQAARAMETHDFKRAGLCLQRALQVNPLSPRVSGLIADLLDNSGSPAALSWRIRTAQLVPNAVEYRLAWAETALKQQEPQSAGFALAGISEDDIHSAACQKLLGALAWESGKAVEAEEHYRNALRLEPTNQAIIVNLATVQLAFTNQLVADSARATLEKLPAASPLRLTALRHLAADAESRKLFSKALTYATEALQNPEARMGDRIRHLELLRKLQNADYEPRLASLKTAAQESPEDACALGRWMVLAEGTTNTLHWLGTLPVQTRTNYPVPLLIADCQVAVEDWKALLAAVSKQDWGEMEFYRLALESLGHRSSKNNVEAEVAWRKALRHASGRLDRLSRLTQLATRWNWKSEEIETLCQIAEAFPKERWAVSQLLVKLHAAGNTFELAYMLSKLTEANPSDVQLKGCLANVCLLRRTELEKAHRLACEVYFTSPDNPYFISTYAYSLLLQNRKDEALKIVSSLSPEQLEIPSVAAYFGIVQASSGQKAAARESLQRAEAAKLLPEEKEIVRQALAKL
jgi:predicted Zn-dependent protease